MNIKRLLILAIGVSSQWCMANQSLVVKVERTDFSEHGTGYLIDDLSFTSPNPHRCQGTPKIATANHNLLFSALGDKATIAFINHSPKVDEEDQGITRIPVIIEKRDIYSDLAVLTLDNAEENSNLLITNVPCVGLATKSANLKDLELQGFTYFSLEPSKNSADLFSKFKTSSLIHDFDTWIEVQGQSDRGMSGGLLTDNNDEVQGMVFKNRKEGSITLVVPTSEIKNSLEALVNDKTPVRKVKYDPATESVALAGMQFQESRWPGAKTGTQIAASDIWKQITTTSQGGEPHDVGGESHPETEEWIGSFKSGVVLSGIEHNKPELREYEDLLRASDFLAVRQTNGNLVQSMADLLRNLEKTGPQGKIEVGLDCYRAASNATIYYLGNDKKNSALQAEILWRSIALSDEFPDIGQRIAIVRQKVYSMEEDPMLVFFLDNLITDLKEIKQDREPKLRETITKIQQELTFLQKVTRVVIPSAK